MNTENKVPSIRFKGFSGGWEEKVFSDSFANIPSNTLSRADLNYENGLAKNIHYGDVLIKFGEILDVEKKILPFVTNNKLVVKLKSATLKDGDVIIADAAEDETVGKCTELFNIKNQIVFSGLHTIAVRPTLPFASKYLGYYLNSSAYHDQLLSLMQGTKVLSISKTIIQTTSIEFPNNPKEQTKIGNYFQQLDTLIAQHQQKHDKLLNLKKALLEKMFPKQGATVPEIRFKGFSGEWEERELIDVAKYRNGKAHENNIDEKGKYIVVNSKFVSTNGEIKKFSNEQIEPLLKNEIAFVLSDVPNGRAIARTFLVKENNAYTLNQRIAGITLPESNSPYYLHILLNRNPYFLKFDDGVNQTNLTKSDVESFSDYYPVGDEQTKIGNLFKQLDTLLTQHQAQLKKLKHIKQTCLEKMFV